MKLKRSAVEGNIPTTSQLELGELALNTYDGKLYTKKNVGGTETVVEIGGAAEGAISDRYSFTATQGQTAFNCNSVLNEIHVFLNGLLLNPTEDYTFSSSIVTLVSGAAAGDELEVFDYSKVVLDDITTTYVKNNFTATSGQTSITTDYNAGLIDVWLNGVKLIDGSDYTATDGTTITFTSALALNDVVETIAWNATNIANRFDAFTYYGKAAEAISKGDLVMFGGAQGDHLLFKKADSSASGFIPEWIIGVAGSDLALNDFGNITSMGVVYGLDTSSYSAGDLLYMDTTTPGALTSTEPDVPEHSILIAAVVRSNANEGTIVTRVTHKRDLDELHGVTVTSKANGDILQYNSTSGHWENTTKISELEAAIEDAEVLALAGL